jgi:hypothetical protein
VVAGAFMATSVDHTFHIGLHQQLHHGFGDAPQEITISIPFMS